ncbi:MAG TPA: DUF507 family protein [Polyangiaceae bacterium]|jgi:uncharacterized protein|nr:DUF507 family protein [Polyangiaceae bacterium]
MRLYSARIPKLAAEMVTALLKEGEVEADSPKEVQADIEAVLNQYMRDEQAVSDRAKEIVSQRGLAQTEFGRMKKLVADERKIKIGEDAIDYVLDQLVEMLMHSANVGEIFVEDYVLRRKMRDPLRKLAAEEDDLQAEVRAQLRHVKEGSSVWEVEYRRMMDDIKRRKGL